MPQIDLDPRQHSHQYELKPMSRWWLVLVLVFACAVAYANGVERPTTWLLIAIGVLVGWFAVLVFPRYWLSKTKG